MLSSQNGGEDATKEALPQPMSSFLGANSALTRHCRTNINVELRNTSIIACQQNISSTAPTMLPYLRHEEATVARRSRSGAIASLGSRTLAAKYESGAAWRGFLST